MAQIFKAKTLVANTGKFAYEVSAPNLVYNTGDQNISGAKNFYTRPTVGGTGVLLIGEASNVTLPNTIVYITGNQTISGTKTFATGVNINGHVGIGIDNNDFNLYVRKSQAGVTVNPDGDSIAVFEGSGNSHITVLASNAQTAGVVLGSPADNFGAYLTWNHDNNALKLATAKPNGFIQLLANNEAEAVRITSAGNVGINTLTPSEKLEVIGNILANNLVYNTGNQTISGIKTFDVLPIFSGNKFITGVDLSAYATNANLLLTGSGLQTQVNTLTTNLFSTGSILDNKINALSGYVSGISLGGLLPSTIVYTTGNQLISGNKIFLNNIAVSGTGNFNNVKVSNIDKLFLSGIDILITGNSSINVYNAIYISGNPVLTGIIPTTPTIQILTNVVYTTGDQTISGSKTFDVAPIVSGNRLITGLDLNSYATTIDLFNTGSILDNKINSLSGYVDSKSITLPSTIVYTTGDQIISGNKNFAENVIVGDQTQDNLLVISGNKIIFGIYPTVNDTGIVYDQGNQIISGVKTFDVFPVVSGNKLITGLDLNSYATNANLFATGSTLNNKINSLSGYVNSQDSIFSGQTFNTGSALDNKINALSGYVNNQDIIFSGQTSNTGSRLDNKINSLSGYINAQDIIFSGQTFSTGSRLDSKINSLSGYVNLRDTLFSGQTFNTGSRLDNKINSLSGYVNSKSITLPTTIVYTTGNQIISGTKNFAQNVIVGDETQDSLLIISGNKITFSVYPTVNGTGIVYNQGDQIISGVKTFDVAPIVSGNKLITGINTSSFASTSNLFATGSTLNNKINSLSGYVNSQDSIFSGQTFNTGSRLDSKINSLSGYVNSQDIIFSGQTASTGSILDNKINALSGYVSGISLGGLLPSTIVYITGNQTISGNKTFVNNIIVSGTGNFNNVKVSSIDKLFLSGIDVVVTGNSSINVYNAIYISGNPVATGFVQLNSYATLANLALTGSILDNKINSLSGYLSGQNSFVINLFNQAATQSAGHNYFGNLSMLFSSDLTQRRFPIFENCVARRASWSQINGTVGSPSLNSTGYFINTSTNPPQTGIISTVINTQSALTPTHYTADFSPPIMINKGDLVVCSLFGPPNYATFPASVRNSVNLYCYN